MNSATAARLLQMNQDFYNRFGASFSATRQRIQPGVRRVLETLRGGESILDLGCGNGELARTLAKRGHRGPYLGLDFSLPLLRNAASFPEGFSARFLQMDLTSDWEAAMAQQFPRSFDVVFCFAVLHHIPSTELRLNILKRVRALLKPGGRFIHSNWQFLNSEKLKARIQPWEAAAVSPSEVDAGDYLLDWRSDGRGLRYVHHFDADELSALARSSGFEIVETFCSDGETNNLGLYQIWK
jgi:2-polyprenyl-3-methyl-5-hydroxy-6-metoxy-1,4-benzoquinol methylase